MSSLCPKLLLHPDRDNDNAASTPKSMPLLCARDFEPSHRSHEEPPTGQPSAPVARKHQHQPSLAKSAILGRVRASVDDPQMALDMLRPASKFKRYDGVGAALSDTPATTAPNSPRMHPKRLESGTSTPRIRPTTLDIPGLTRSKVSPDGRIAQRDVGSKLVIVMVGLPARGKSYVTKKIARYLNWLQHDTRIFNVGERRRVVAGGSAAPAKGAPPQPTVAVAKILVNGETSEEMQYQLLPPPALSAGERQEEEGVDTGSRDAVPPPPEAMEQNAEFFDPSNARASQIREQLALETLDDLLDFILDGGGSVGILDATNSTLERRKAIMQHVRRRAGLELNVLFLESVCQDKTLLESNMRLKLSGPDYKDQDPIKALEDFKKRVANYEKAYVPLGEYEELNDMAYIRMIDVGRKVVSHQIKGFLSSQTVYYLLNFNLAPRQIWITRHGQSVDNVNGKIGGDSDLSDAGHAYAKALTKFVAREREEWDIYQREKALTTHFPPRRGDASPPNPEYTSHTEAPSKSFCIWTSMLKRSIQTSQYFDEEDFDIKQMRMLDELNAGSMEGLTYEEIRSKYGDEYERRKQGKLQYRYPGAGGEGYLDVINRLRPVIVEVERMTDHVLLIGHRSISRVLLAYFLGLNRDDVADLDVPLGTLYMLEPKPYGVEFKAYRYNAETDRFDHIPDYKLQRATTHAN